MLNESLNRLVQQSVESTLKRLLKPFERALRKQNTDKIAKFSRENWYSRNLAPEGSKKLVRIR